jgi:hypothetical protein
MNAELLRSSIDTLKSVRVELHGNVENSALEMLDEAIVDLESFQQDSSKVSTRDVLYVLGQVLEKLPVIIELIHILSNAMK